ncbi:DoxX family protein [Ralstonia solanacearum]|uniref:DoxX family protein n=2 Tax=Ralstonia solanacearum TaxID=305 RepID=A0AAW5ZVM3_RALSL|nr:DoxX family protein [Ralstonia solanacearum]AST32960.1 DoxX family protein [Ralstonia solanacearum]AYB50835.1 DoxX family protein [Ralstonia solanacearum]AYB55389.1 DoxX family protein [Ralstonia solanacearum]MBB6590536.1 DoxX family protein [Ralstonia solanacearum]MBB6594734.1 DoxX family protein [Ralstonia solanacearum]
MNAAIERWRDELILLARVLMMLLFLISGWGKVTGFAGTVGYMGTVGAPMPMLAAIIAVIMEFGVGIALLIGFWTRPLALLMALFVLGTALIAHTYWNVEGAMQTANMVQFYKNLSIMGGLILLSVTGAGKYALQKS